MSFDCQVYVWVLLKDSNIIAVSGPGHDGNYIGEVTKPTITNRAHVFHLSFFYMCALGGALSVKSYREWNGGVWHLHSAGRRTSRSGAKRNRPASSLCDAGNDFHRALEHPTDAEHDRWTACVFERIGFNICP